jgi:hypothetical protein
MNYLHFHHKCFKLNDLKCDGNVTSSFGNHLCLKCKGKGLMKK